MNGIHDMGGMQDMGPIRAEKNEPVFHEKWEGRVYAMDAAMNPWGQWNLDAKRYQGEIIAPEEYLRMSYYERRFTVLLALLAKSGLLTVSELESGKPASHSAKSAPALPASEVDAYISRGTPKRRDLAVEARFQAGQRVHARNIHPIAHTRLPRYARGKTGTVERDHGVFVFPDTNFQFSGEKPQHVYSVRFAARELWGEQASANDSIYLDLWDDYLEPA
jgi:nitrile hydratase beta subunit